MGVIVDAECGSCGFTGAELLLGEGKLGAWPFEGRLYACKDCRTLQVREMVVPLRKLRAAAKGKAEVSMPLPKTTQELAELLAEDRGRRPTCESCAKRLRGHGQRGHDPSCPGCGGPLKLALRGHWD